MSHPNGTQPNAPISPRFNGARCSDALRFVFSLALSCAVFSGCTPGDDEGESDAETPLGSNDAAEPDDRENVDAAVDAMDAAARMDGSVLDDAGSRDASEPTTDLGFDVGPDSTTISALGLTLEFSAGALASSQRVTITERNETPAGYQRYSKHWEVSPSNLSIAKPVKATMEFSDNSRLAAAFSADGRGVVEFIGGTTSGSKLEVELSRLGRLFVGNGAEYDPAPRHKDADCGAVVDVIRENNSSQTAVFAHLLVEDCEGVPLRGLKTADFSPLEDGAPLSSEASGFTVFEEPSSVRAFVMLTLDFSSSTKSFAGTVIEGAKAFVEQVEKLHIPVYIGVYPFAGDRTDGCYSYVSCSAPMLQPTLDYAAVKQVLDNIPRDFEPFDATATNLNGAISSSYKIARHAASAFERRQQAAGTGLPLVVAFTDGRDTAGFGGSVPAGSTIVVALASSVDYRQSDVLTLVGGNDYARNIVELRSTAQLVRDFRRVAYRLAAKVDGAKYKVAYCSPTRTGSHSFTVKVNPAAKTEAETLQFTSRVDFSGCSAEKILHYCDAKECGADCALCDDRAATCNNNQCISWCSVSGVCDTSEFTNVTGIRQSCPADACSASSLQTHFTSGATDAELWGQLVPFRTLVASDDGFLYGLDPTEPPARLSQSGGIIWLQRELTSLPGSNVRVASNGDLLVAGGRLRANDGTVLVQPIIPEGSDNRKHLTVWADGGFLMYEPEATVIRYDAFGAETHRDTLVSPTGVSASLTGVACARDDGGFWITWKYGNSPSQGHVAQHYGSNGILLKEHSLGNNFGNSDPNVFCSGNRALLSAGSTLVLVTDEAVYPGSVDSNTGVRAVRGNTALLSAGPASYLMNWIFWIRFTPVVDSDPEEGDSFGLEVQTGSSRVLSNQATGTEPRWGVALITERTAVFNGGRYYKASPDDPAPYDETGVIGLIHDTASYEPF